MKNQYVGDVGDFGKYAMLRVFAEAGVKIGVNWYLTENDGSNDGKYTKYLEDGDLRPLCPEVFDVLKRIAFEPKKTVRDVQQSGLLKDAVYYDELLKTRGTPPEREYQRNQWFFRSLDALAGTELIFMDPDNGLLESNDASKPGAEKYILPDEVEMYFNEGHNVVYYCHKGRRSWKAWSDYKSVMFERIPSAKPAVLTFHKGTQRSYIFLIHEQSFVMYRDIIEDFMRRWYRLFSEEYTNKGNAAGETIGAPFTITKSDGSQIMFQNRADGRIQVIKSMDPYTAIVMTPDSICRQLGL